MTCLFSFIYTVIVNMMQLPSELYVNLMLITLAVFVAYFAYLISKSEYTEQIFQALEIETTFLDNEIEALRSVETGTWLVVYSKEENVVYDGWLHFKELEPDKRQYITLRNFRKYLLGDDGKPCHPYIEEHDTESGEEVIIFYENIKRIEKRGTRQYSI